MHSSQPLIKPHRFARAVLWAKAMLAWLAVALLSETGHRIGRRRIRQRYRFISLAKIERLVGALAIIRTVELAKLQRIKCPPARDAAPPGFRRRTPRAGAWRATLGGRFRKALKHRDPRQRFQRLLAALGDIDAFARRYLVKRGLRRLTKRRAVVMVAPPADAIAPLPASTPRAVDTS